MTNRLNWLDNLRSITILLVVLYHVGGVYEAAGLWASFWIVDDPSTITWVGIVGILFDIMVMPIMFFIAGYLVTLSLENKTSWEFINGKFKRLMVPWLIAVVTLIPIYKVIFLYSRGLPQQPWNTYFHITNPNSQNWLWFLPVLFAFNLLYLLVSKTKIKFQNVSLGWTITGMFVIGFAYSFFIGGIAGFRSWTLTPVIDFENERLLIYFLMFLLGAQVFQKGILKEKSQTNKLYNTVNAITWIPITVHIFTRIVPFIYPEGFSVTPMYRFVWWISFDVSLLCMMYVMIQSFRRYLDRTGTIWIVLNRNSYGVYIIHVIMIGVFGTLLLNFNIPAAVKYLLLFLLTYLVSNVVVTIYRSLVQTIKIQGGKS